jgi:hypothetical protein
MDVEDRNVAARTVAARADAVAVVGRPGLKGVHALVRVIADVASCGVDAERILPVVVTAPRSPRARAEIAAAIADLARPSLGGIGTPSPLFLPPRPVEQAFRDGTPLPAQLATRTSGAVLAVLERAGRRSVEDLDAVLVTPGSLGSAGGGDW